MLLYVVITLIHKWGNHVDTHIHVHVHVLYMYMYMYKLAACI